MNLDAVLSFLAATLRTATPIALATLACTISERAGVINIGIEGTMIASAFMGAVGAYYSGSAWVGLLCGAAAAASTVSSMTAAIRIATKRFIKKILLLIDKWRYFFQTCSKTRSQFSPKILRIASSEYPRATRPRVTLINER